MFFVVFSIYGCYLDWLGFSTNYPVMHIKAKWLVCANELSMK